MRCDISFVPVPMRTFPFNENMDLTIRNNRHGAASFLRLASFQKIRRMPGLRIRNAYSFSNADVWDTSLCPTAFYKVRVEPYRT
jgi:hypothetical protein